MAKKINKLLAVDIGSSSVKVVELSKVGRGYRIDAAAIEPMQAGVWKDGLPIEPEACAIIVQRAIAASGSSLKDVIVSTPTAASMSRVLPISSSLSNDDIEITLEAGLSQYIPFSAEEVSMDFMPIGPTVGSKDSQDILLVAIQKDFINTRDLCLDTVGFKARVIDVDIYALLNVIRMIEPIDSYAQYHALAIVEIGADRTGLHVVQGDNSVYAREQPFGGERLTEILSDQTGMSFEQASQKKKSGLWQDSTMTDALDAYYSELAEQMLGAMQVYQSNHPRIEIQKVIVLGGGSNIPNVERVLAEHLKMQVDVLDTSSLFSLGPKCRIGASDLKSLSVACGLAMRNFV